MFSIRSLANCLQKRQISMNRDFYIKRGNLMYLIDTSEHHSKYIKSVFIYKTLEQCFKTIQKDKIGLKIQYKLEYINTIKMILNLREIVQGYQLEAADHYIDIDGKLKFISKERDLYRQHTHEYIIQLYRSALYLPYKHFTYEKFSLDRLKAVKPK